MLVDLPMASLAQVLSSAKTIRRFAAFFLEEFGFGIGFRSFVLKKKVIFSNRTKVQKFFLQILLHMFWFLRRRNRK